MITSTFINDIINWLITPKPSKSLHDLNDRMLDDIGIHRGQISRIERGIDLTPCERNSREDGDKG